MELGIGVTLRTATRCAVPSAPRLNIKELARRIGYSESTLSQACQAAVGRTAKQVADLRTVLEAKRLLVHSRATVAHIGGRLGVSEPTNFVKLFRRLAAMTPLEFRAANAWHVRA